MEKEIISQKIVNGVEITEFSDGSSTFKPLPDPPKEILPKKSWLQKVRDWFHTSKVTPYVKIRNMGDPLDKCNPDEVYGCPKAVEVGIKVKF